MGVKTTIRLTRAEAERRLVATAVEDLVAMLRRENGEEMGVLPDSVVPWDLRDRGITAKDAFEIHLAVEVERRRAKLEHAMGMLASNYPDGELEDAIEALNDRAKGGEGFENYLIVETTD